MIDVYKPDRNINHRSDMKICNIAACSVCAYCIHSCAQRKAGLTCVVKSKVINSIPSEQWMWGPVICYGWTVSAAVSQQEAELCSLLHAGTQWRMCVCTGCLCVQARAHGISFSEGVYSPQTLCFFSLCSYLIVCRSGSARPLCASVCSGLRFYLLLILQLYSLHPCFINKHNFII